MFLKTFAFFALIFMAIFTTDAFAQAPSLEAGVSQTLAKWRAANYSDVRYKLSITLEKGAPLMKGELEIRVNLTEEGAKNDLILDWRTTPFANDKDTPYAVIMRLNEWAPSGGMDALTNTLNEHIVLSKKFLKTGENFIRINFASPIKTSGAAITRYVDREDGAEYIYSLFVPSDASTAFPLFDQPDLKARFKLNVNVPKEWKVISNTNLNSQTQWRTTTDAEFSETKPISTYVFAFAAGEFTEFEDKNDSTTSRGSGDEKVARRETSGTDRNTSSRVEDAEESESWRISNARFSGDDDTRRFTAGYLLDTPSAQNKETLPAIIYVRKSQAEKFKAHAAEVFRLNREGVKFLETYFDYKFPFPKYDLVLIPEFPFGGMEHAGATFLRESSIIFPSEPTANDFISRANLIFHEAAHQWFGDTVTMKWFDDLWLKEGFAEFMAYKTLEKVMPEYNAWKAFYERNKPLAYLTDSTRGTTPIYQEIRNLSAAKSAYGNIVYRKAPSFLRQAEFYLGGDKFQTAVRAFLKKHQFANAEWTDLVKEFETASKQDLKDWAKEWVTGRGVIIFRPAIFASGIGTEPDDRNFRIFQQNSIGERSLLKEKTRVLIIHADNSIRDAEFSHPKSITGDFLLVKESDKFIFPNYQDYGYGIFLLDAKSLDYILQNIQNEKDDFLRSMMWGALWDSVREAELSPKDYVELAIKNISVEKDELTIQTILSRVSTAMSYYLSDAQRTELSPKLEDILINKMQNAQSVGQKITFYRAFLNIASGERGKDVLKKILKGEFRIEGFNCRGDSCGRPMSEAKNGSTSRLIGQAQDLPLQTAPTILKTKDKFDVITKLAILGDADAPRLLAELEKTETSDDAKRYAYAVGAGVGTKEAKEKYFNDFVNNKEISESWIESAFVPFNSPRHAEWTLPFLEKALAELPNLKRNRKIFFVNGWLAAFIGGQKDEKALAIVNKFLADNPNLDKDLRLKILENVDLIERAVRIRAKYGK